MTIRSVLAFIIFLLFSNAVTGQNIYSATRLEYKLNNFTYQFYLMKDSSCFLKKYYPDNDVYLLYKGRVNRIDDTLLTFRYQPVVKFTCNKGYRINDSVRIRIKQADTTLSSRSYRIKAGNNTWKIIQLKEQTQVVFVKGARNKSVCIDTKFTDPLTGKKIYSTFNSLAIPDLNYYGSGSAFSSLKISIIKKRLTIYPDYKHIHDKDNFVKIQ